MEEILYNLQKAIQDLDYESDPSLKWIAYDLKNIVHNLKDVLENKKDKFDI